MVTTDSTTVGDGRKHHYVHGIPVGPNSEEIASMVLQDAVEKANSLKKLTYLPVQDAMVVLRKTTLIRNDELHYEMLHTRRSQKSNTAFR